MPILRPLALTVEIAIFTIAITAALRSSKMWDTRAESRSSPNVNWVRSLEPILGASLVLESINRRSNGVEVFF
jgi:hypothetical protein